MSARLVFAAVRGQFAQAMERDRQAIAAAGTSAIKDAAAQAKREGRASIAEAGFSRKWQNALRVDVFPKRGDSIDAAAFVHHNIAYAGIFERGGTIHGSPLLWVPLPAAPRKIGGQRVTPRVYVERIGSLHAIKRPGKRPLLAAYVTRAPGAGRSVSVASLRAGARRARRGQANAAFGGRASSRFAVVSLPLFVGVPAVHLRKRLSLTAVFNRARATLGPAFIKHLGEELR